MLNYISSKNCYKKNYDIRIAQSGESIILKKLINGNGQSFIKKLCILNFIIAGLIVLGGIIFLLIQKFDFFLDFFNAKYIFSDFTEIMLASLSKNAYSQLGVSYPPLAVIILYPFALISKSVINLSNYDMVHTPQFWTSFLLFLFVGFTAAALLLKMILKVDKKSFIFFYAFFLTSSMAFYAFYRGNVILLAFVAILFFLAFYKSKNAALKELALIALAAAGAIKIYPLFFGVILLKDKKFFASARVAVYTLILFFVPFLLFEGFSDVRHFLANMNGFSTGTRYLTTRNLSIYDLVNKFFYALKIIFKADLRAICRPVAYIVIVITGIAALLGALLSKNKFSIYIICLSVIVVIPWISYYYGIIFAAIPLAEFINSYDKFSSKRKIFYFIFFIFVPSLFFSVLRNFVFQSLFLVVVLFYESIRNIKIYKNKKTKSEEIYL